MTTTAATTVQLDNAAKSETFTVIASIAGAKAHNVTARTLLEDAETEVVARRAYRAGKMVDVMKTIQLEAGTTLYLYANCGTTRSAGNWRYYENSYAPADEVTCAKCLKH